MTPSEKMPPNLKEILDDQKADIFSSLFCVNIGKIESVNNIEQTVEVSLQIKRLAQDGTSVSWPVLVDCPFFVLQGGGAYIDMPVKKGDYCLMLFNDRNIDTWWDTGNVSDPNTPRKHSLSDGFALVGFNPRPNALDHDGTKTRIINQDGIELNGNSKQFVTHAELNSALQTFITALNLHVHTCAVAGSPSTPPISGMSIDISAAKTTTIKTGG